MADAVHKQPCVAVHPKDDEEVEPGGSSPRRCPRRGDIVEEAKHGGVVVHFRYMCVVDVVGRKYAAVMEMRVGRSSRLHDEREGT